MTLEMGLVALFLIIATVAIISFIVSRQQRKTMPSDFRLAYVVHSIDAERAVIHALQKSKIPFRAIPTKIENAKERYAPIVNVQDRFNPVEIYVSEMNINAAKTVLARLKPS